VVKQLEDEIEVPLLDRIGHRSVGARSLNVELQKVLNPPGDIRIERFGWTFCPGDKVMQVENNYDKEVYTAISASSLASTWMNLSSRPMSRAGRLFTRSANSTSWLLAYATTIHKSQGSEYLAAVIPVSTQHYTMLRRNLITPV
jgi:exodeoxyribonuclease V alpha subunit